MPDKSIGERVAEDLRTATASGDGYDIARAINAAIAADRQEREATIRDREAEILRLRTSEHSNAQAIDRLGQFLGIPLGERVPADVVAAAEKRVAELVGLLKECEWKGRDYEQEQCCPVCEHPRNIPGIAYLAHYEGCRLAAAIKGGG